MTFQINQKKKDEIPKMINVYMIKHGINKIEDFFSPILFQNLVRENHLNKALLSIICNHLICVNTKKIEK